MNRRVQLIIVVGIAILLRFWQLGSVPVSPDWDEAALGYNAYSILKTGMDEYGYRFPMSLRSFGDYKPPLYVYLTVPSVALFGLNTFSVRLPSAVMGVIAVIGVYALVAQLIAAGSKQYRHIRYLPFIASLLLAVSPWHIQFSRVAFEANTGVTLQIWAAYLFLKGLIRKNIAPVSAILFSLGLYSYHSERVFIPLLLCAMVYLHRDIIFSRAYRLTFVISVALFVAVSLPLLPEVFGTSASARLSGTNAFSNPVALLSRTSEKLRQDNEMGNFIGQVFDNRRVVYFKTIAAGYLSHFSVQWLFLNGDNPRHHAPDMGLMYLWELPFVAIGLIVLSNMLTVRHAWMIYIWLLLAPVAASVTSGLPHAVRTLVFLPSLQIFCAAGIVYMLGRLDRAQNIVRLSAYMAFCIIGLYSGFYYGSMYFVHQNAETAKYWQYGYEDLVAYTQTVQNSYKKIVVSTSLDQSYIFFLFYTKYDPYEYLKSGGSGAKLPQGVRARFGKYEFRKIDWTNEQRDGSVLYIGSPSEMPKGNVQEILYPDGEPAFEVSI